MTLVEETTHFNVHSKFTSTPREPKNLSIDPVSFQVAEIVRTVVFVYMCGIMGLLGMATNVANMTVFVRQGFKDSINISLMGRSKFVSKVNRAFNLLGGSRIS